MSENYINHIALVLDASYSMSHLKEPLIKVADDQIAHLAMRSKELDQETRVTVYTFDDHVSCVIYDKDVLRLPSIRAHYSIGGNTALVDAAIQSQTDLALTPEKYGDHAFLTYVLTDGQENRSRHTPTELLSCINGLPPHWTVAALVPDVLGKHEAKRFGFPPDNIAVWDTSSSKGMAEAGDTIRQATDTYMINRTSGIRGSRSMFSTGTDTLNRHTVAGLKPLAEGTYKLLDVNFGTLTPTSIRDYVAYNGYTYRIGCAYYQLSKTESIQPKKSIAVLEKSTRRVYTGPEARDIIGLPDIEVRVKPNHNPEYDVFVQSTSVNRVLVPGTKLLLID